MKTTPLFIHSLWRTGSTWWWLQLRNSPDHTAYYEPFHENLLSRTHAQCTESHTSKPKAKIFRHPETPDHYFSEFPLRPEGGVALFEKDFILDNYIRMPGENDPAMKNYVRSLIDHAKDQDTAPSFKFCRSMLRGAWMKAAFGGTHLYLVRDPRATFDSACSFVTAPQKDGPGNYFLACPVMIVAQHADHPLFRKTAARFGLTPFHAPDFKSEITHFGQIASTLDTQTHYEINALLWTLSLAHATRYADAIIDADLANDPSYRNAVSDRIYALNRQSLAIADDYALPEAKNTLRVSPAMKEIIAESAALLLPNWSRLHGENAISQASRDSLEDILRPSETAHQPPAPPLP